MCEPQIFLRLRMLLKKMDLFKNWKERQDLCYNIGFFEKHVGKKKIIMIVKGMAKRVFLSCGRQPSLKEWNCIPFNLEGQCGATTKHSTCRGGKHKMNPKDSHLGS
jgi:hypothetical protein